MRVGGICGYQESNSLISNVHVQGEVYSRRTLSTQGGIAGYTFGTIENARFNGIMVGNGDMGGIADSARNATLINCVVSANIQLYIVKANRSAGGIVGTAYYTYISDTIGQTEIITTNVSFVGAGLIDGQNLTPYLGIIAGYTQGCTLSGINWDGSSGINGGSLSSDFEYNIKTLFGIKISSSKMNQRANLDNNGDGIGKKA
jgi:hypothetical protein